MTSDVSIHSNIRVYLIEFDEVNFLMCSQSPFSLNLKKMDIVDQEFEITFYKYGTMLRDYGHAKHTSQRGSLECPMAYFGLIKRVNTVNSVVICTKISFKSLEWGCKQY